MSLSIVVAWSDDVLLPQMLSHLASVPLWRKPIFVLVKDSFSINILICSYQLNI